MYYCFVIGLRTVWNYAVVKPLWDEPIDKNLLSLSDYMISKTTRKVMQPIISEKNEEVEPTPRPPEIGPLDMIVCEWKYVNAGNNTGLPEPNSDNFPLETPV